MQFPQKTKCVNLITKKKKMLAEISSRQLNRVLSLIKASSFSPSLCVTPHYTFFLSATHYLNVFLQYSKKKLTVAKFEY